jgi:hypothetical protein
MKSITRYLLLTALIIPVSIYAKDHKNVKWTIKGKFGLYYQLPELQYAMAMGKPFPLKGIQVRVSAAEKGIGVWNSWPDVTTNSDGSFTVTNDKNQWQRKFKVEFRFHSDELEIRHENSTAELFSKDAKWYTAYDKGDFFEAGTIDLEHFIFRDNAFEDMGEWEPRRHAEIWIVAKASIDYLKSYGSAYAYTKQVKIKYPHDDAAIKIDGLFDKDVTSSYANPLNGVIYLYKSETEDHFDVHSIYHEMMHIWAYEHNASMNGGETALIKAIVAQHESHGFTTNKVSFHEGFAEYAADELCLALFPSCNCATVPSSGTSGSTTTAWEEGTHYHSVRLPFNRDQLNEGVNQPGNNGSSKLTSLSKMQTHDAGWWSFLHILTTEGLEAKNFSRSIKNTSTESSASTFKCTSCFIGTEYGAHQTGGCTLSRRITFKDVLRTFISDESAGYSKNLNSDDMYIDKFLKRLKAIQGISTKDIDTYYKLSDPADKTQPFEAWCK